MAGLCGVKILLLWAGIIGLGKCDSAAATAATTMASNQASITQPQNPTSDQASSPQQQNPTIDQASSPQQQNPTIDQASSPQQQNPTSSQTSPPQPAPAAHTSNQPSVQTPKVSPVQCSYTVNPIRYGIQINITSSAVVDASIEINEEGKPETKQHFTVRFNQTSHPFKQLKPCTKYNTRVKVHYSGQTTSCNITGNDTSTSEIGRDDIVVSGSNKSVCFQTEWYIDPISVQTNGAVVKGVSNSVCVKPNYADLCSDLTLIFTSQSCNTSFPFPRNITLDYLDPKDIQQTVTKTFPANITAELPPKCKNLSIDYACHEKQYVNETKKLSQLEPFTNYSCTGHIKDNNVSIHKTTEVLVQIDCDLKINVTTKNRDNTSVELTMKTTSENCEAGIPKLSYDCRCYTSSRHEWHENSFSSSGETCKISGLTPFTKYTCWVTAKYNKYSAPSIPVDVTTEVGVPEKVNQLKLMVKEHNTITVTCKHLQFNGPKGEIKARLWYDGTNKLVTEKKSTRCDFKFDNLYYSTSYKVEVFADNGQFKSDPEIKTISTDYNDKAVIGFLVFLIIVTSVALLLVIYKIFILKRRKSHDLSENMILISTANDEENLLPVEPIAAEVLLEAYKRKLADEGRLFLAEFQSIPRIFSRHAVKEAKKPCNVPKNRYVDILPYDYNRVRLTTGNGEAGCDYINASFIDGYKEAKKYIAAQGPKDETVSDFWRMVWEQQSSIIVMVTRCEEGNRVKCAQYWPSPERETEIFEEFILKLNSEEHCPDYTIRHLIITNKREKTSEREVTHIQFMSWPDHGVPAEPHLLLKLRRRVNSFKNFFSGPIVLHCSAGVGRTGTYIGIDAMMEALEAEGRVDIYGYMVRLRRQRCLMVQVEAQYILIHQALVEHNQFGETEIPLSELHSILSTLKLKSSESELTLMEEEFDRLPTFLNWRTFNTGITEENKERNRSSSVIPYDYNRVLLKLDEGLSRDSDAGEDDEEESSDEEDEESSRYINASHINGYWGPRALIAAQTPLPDTMADFWMMVYQKKVSTIVMLSEENKESDTVYWDKDKRTFGDLEVEVASTDANPAFISRNLLIRHVRRTESRSVRQFQFLKWVNRELPETPQCLADMMKEIKNSGGGSKSQTTVVHCNDGSSRTGVFCALWNLMDSAQTEKLVDVFQMVKTLRKERQNMISSLEQYQFLYETMQMAFPVQNGEVKAAQASPADSIQIISETKAAEQPEAAESTQLMIVEEKKEEPDKDSQLMEDTSNSSTVPLEI